MRHPILASTIASGLILAAAAPGVGLVPGAGLVRGAGLVPGVAAPTSGLVLGAGAPAAARPQEVTPNSRVVEDTVRLDPRTTRRTRRELRTDPNGGERLARTVEEVREEGPDGRLRIVRTTSEPDLNGRSRTMRREVVTTVPVGGGVQRTEIETSVPAIDGGGLVGVERVEQIERREGEKLLEAERTTYRRSVGTESWEATERRITELEHGDREVRTVERVYRLDGNDDLALNDRIVTTEWTDARGTEHVTQEVHSTDVPFLTRSEAPRLYRKIEVVRTRLPEGGHRTTREVRERRMNGFPLVERVIEEARPTPGGTTTVRTVQRPDGNGRLQTVSVSRSEESGSRE